MAWAHSALSSSYSILPFINPIRKALILASFSRPSSRKNSLRPKLLKTLTKPPIHQSLEIPNPTFEGLHPESEHEQIEQLEQMEQKELMVQAEMVNLPPFPETQGWITPQLVLYAIGGFIVQTVCAVWFLDSYSRKEEGDEVMLTGVDNRFGDGAIYVEKPELEEKIAEIRVLAREAREIEAKKSDKEDSPDYIKEEVDKRVSRLEKKLRSNREKLIGPAVGHLNGLNKNKEDEKGLGVEGKDGKLVFEKKFKFKGSTDISNSSPKGFGSGKSYRRENRRGRQVMSSGTVVSDTSAVATKKRSSYTTVPKAHEDERGRVSGRKLENGEEKLRIEARERSGSVYLRSGEIQETSHELVNPRESSELKTNPSCANDDESNPADTRSKDAKREIENDVWWTRLPYACAIFMSRDSENEGPSGLFSLTLDDGPLSHTVAFEDRYDATNFCYILESFFEELGDVTVDIVLLSNEELVDAAKCTSRKLIVVRKGQLKLYAGKPLEEVELALRSLIK